MGASLSRICGPSSKGVSLALFWLLLTLPAVAGAQGSPTGLTVEITKNNCPVYDRPDRMRSTTIFTVQPGDRYPVLDLRHVANWPAPFYQIQYGNPGEVGWVYGGFVNAIKPILTGDTATDSGRNVAPLHKRITSLLEMYNDEKSQLTSAYNIRPFPSFHFGATAADSSGLSVVDGKLTLPLFYESDARRLYLPRADKFLLQLIMLESFKEAAAGVEQVELALHFQDGKPPVRLLCRYQDWQRVGRASLDQFWRILEGEDKNRLWQ